MGTKKEKQIANTPKPRGNEFRISNVPDDVHSDIINIHDNTGISISALVKPFLRQLRDSYPENMRKPKPKN